MTGAVYDRGYRPYDGTLGGRAAARWALYRHTIRRALGIRRSWRQKVAPFVLLAIVTIPAIVNVGVAYLTRNADFVGDRIQLMTYREYVGVSSALLLFVALTAPDTLCPDRRQRVLPLMFARPLTGGDYVAAKFTAITTIVFAFSTIPQAVLFVGSMLVDDAGALTYLGDNAEVLWQVPVAALLLAIYYTAVSLAIAAMTDRRIVAGAAIIGLFLFTSITAAVLLETRRFAVGGDIRALINLWALPLHLRDLVFLGEVDPGGDLAGVDNGGIAAVAVYVAVVGVAIGVLARRYRWTDR